MRVLVTGANGFIGRQVVKACLRHGHQVSACVRRRGAAASQEVTWLDVNYSTDTHIQAWVPRLKNIDAVINCVGVFQEKMRHQFDTVHRLAASALFQASVRVGVKKVIQISALGADESASSEFHLSKKRADDFLSSLDIDWTIIRPSVVYGRAAASSKLLRGLAALPLTPLPGNGAQLIQPIDIEDFCRLVIQALETKRMARQYVDAVGAEPVTLKELLLLLKIWLGLPVQRFFNVPMAIVFALARLPSFLRPTLLTADALAMLTRGSYANFQQLVAISGIYPRSIRAVLNSEKADATDIGQSKEFLILPLLRVSLAFLWIYTAYVSAFVYPYSQSLAMLSNLPVSAELAPWLLYGAALLAGALGVAMLLNFRLRRVLQLQIAAMLLYTLLITLFLPEMWAHPFAPIAKNIPLIVCSMLLLSRESSSWTS